MMAFLHWLGGLLWALLQASVGLLMWGSLIVVIGLAILYATVAVAAPFLKERSSFKKAKGQSKGPLNPYANRPSEPKP
jgi:hypothetical protein